MFIRQYHEFSRIELVHRNQHLSLRWTPESYINLRSFFSCLVNDLVNFFNLLSQKIREIFLDFDNFFDIQRECLNI